MTIFKVPVILCLVKIIYICRFVKLAKGPELSIVNMTEAGSISDKLCVKRYFSALSKQNYYMKEHHQYFQNLPFMHVQEKSKCGLHVTRI